MQGDKKWLNISSEIQSLDPVVNEITQELLFILNSNDGTWRYCVINILISQSQNKLSPFLIEALIRIAEHPSKIDAEDEVDDVANDVIANKGLCG
ncbi:MAG: DUF5071 domain-containing protein [Chryseobacterium sp.]|nr:MAG: DUF5071 domain-containing protein [Chryseobacterium sp.]